MVKLLGISGSLRAGSYNSMLVREAARVFAPDEFIFADLRLPLYDGDLEARGMPDSILILCDQIREADAIVISTPEYNKAPAGVLKNALDWISRPRPAPMAGKPVTRILVTHFHPDHIGNAGWLAEETGAPLWITRTEWLMHQMLYLDDAAYMHHAQVDAYEAAGLGHEYHSRCCSMR